VIVGKDELNEKRGILEQNVADISVFGGRQEAWGEGLNLCTWMGRRFKVKEVARDLG